MFFLSFLAQALLCHLGHPGSHDLLCQMVVIREVRHPLALDFANERLVYHLRKDEKKSWDYIAANVENNSGEPSTRATVQRAYLRFSVKNGKSAYKFANCGRFAWKLTPAIEKFLLRKLLCLRKKMICTSVTLQGVLAKEKGVQLADSAIRKFLISEETFLLACRNQ